MDLRSSDEARQRDIPSFIEPRPPLIHHPFMRPRPEKGINLLEKFEEDSDIEEPDLVQVYLRMKPCKVHSNLYELRSDKCLVTSLDTTTAGHGRRTQHNVSKMYTFSRIFKAECNQKEIFDEVVKDNLKRLVDGHSFTLLTYGASGSGKTYTVMGTVNSPGLVPRSLEYLFKLVDAAQTPIFKPSETGSDRLSHSQQEFELQWVKRLLHISSSFRDKYRRMSVQLHSDLTVSSVDLTNRTKHYVWVSFVEIYNEAIYDLLAPPDRRTKLRLREDASGNVYVKGVTQAFVRSGEEAYDVMVAGKHNLVVGATGIHAQSSRSHCIFTITMLTEKDGEIRSSAVRLCDLAGCERQRAARNTGARMLESKAINSSLHVLERCLHMLRKKQRVPGDCSLIPYRECKLTRLLGSGLSGARGEAVTMVVTVNPAPQYAHETRHVLSLATVAKDIQINNTMIDPTVTISSLECTQDSSAHEYADEILRLRTENERLHFELLQAQSCISQLRRAMEEKQQENATTMMELVEETKDMMRQFYEKQLETLHSQKREMEEDYEARLAEMAEENKMINRELKETSIRNIHEYLETRNGNDNEEEPSKVNPSYSSDSDNDSDCDVDLDESLEPVNHLRKSLLNRETLHKYEQVIDLINESSEGESDDQETDDEKLKDDESKAEDTRNEELRNDTLDQDSLYDTKKSEELSVHNPVTISKDSLYNGDDESNMEYDDGEIENTKEFTANLTQPISKLNDNSLAAEIKNDNSYKQCSTHEVDLTIETDINNLNNVENDKSECEEMFNVSIKLEKSQDVTVDNINPNISRGTYFVANAPQTEITIDNNAKNLNHFRGTYFVSDKSREMSFYKESYFQNSNEKSKESPEKINEESKDTQTENKTSNENDYINNGVKEKESIVKNIKVAETAKEMLVDKASKNVGNNHDTMKSIEPAKNLEPVEKSNESVMAAKVSDVDSGNEKKEHNEIMIKNVGIPIKPSEIIMTKSKNSNEVDVNNTKRIELTVTNIETPVETQARNKESEFVRPTKVAETLVSKIMKSFKDRKSSNSSLTQFEQLELAVHDSNVSKDAVKSLEINIPTKLATKSRYFDDSIVETISSIEEASEPAIEKDDGIRKEQKTKYCVNNPNDNIYSQLSSAAKLQEKRLQFDSPDTVSTTSEKQEQSKDLETNSTAHSLILTTKAIKEAHLFYNENDRVVHNDILLSKSPSITREKTEDFEPSVALKKVLGESFTKPEILSSTRKQRLAKHDSVDIFESPVTNIMKINPKENNSENTGSKSIDESKINAILNKNTTDNTSTEIVSVLNAKDRTAEIAHEFVEELMIKQKIKAFVEREKKSPYEGPVNEGTTNIDNDKNEKQNTPKMITEIKQEDVTLQNTILVHQSSTDDIKISNMEIIVKPRQTETQTSKENNTIDEFEDIVKDLTNVRATDFELLVSKDDISVPLNIDSSQDSNAFETKLTSKDNITTSSNVDSSQDIETVPIKNVEKRETTQRRTKFEEAKYNLRNKGKSNVAEEKGTKETEQAPEISKTRSVNKRCLRLRRRKNEENPDSDPNDNKLKDIINLKKEFSDVTLGLPAVKKDVQDIPSPEKNPDEEENIPPIMGIQSCPSKSVLRSRRKLFTPRAEPLEESPGAPGDSSERVYVPRPSYHRPRARRKL